MNVKNSIRPQLAQGVNLTPQLLQSIRLLQLTAPQLEQELRQALDRNPMLEPDEADEVGETDTDTDAAELEMQAWDELPEPAFLSGGSLGGADDDACARIAETGSSDYRVRLLQQLAFQWDEYDLRLAQWWLDHSDDRGFLEQSAGSLAAEGSESLAVTTAALETVRQRLLRSGGD